MFTAGIWSDAGDRMPGFTYKHFKTVADAQRWCDKVLTTDKTAKLWEVRHKGPYCGEPVLKGGELHHRFAFVPPWVTSEDD